MCIFENFLFHPWTNGHGQSFVIFTYTRGEMKNGRVKASQLSETKSVSTLQSIWSSIELCIYYTTYKAHWRIGRLLLCWVSTTIKECVLIESEANLDSNVYSKYKFETCKPGECRQQKLKNGHQLRLSSVASCAPPECSRQALALLIALHPLRLINGVCVCVMSEYCVMPSTSVY